MRIYLNETRNGETKKIERMSNGIEERQTHVGYARIENVFRVAEHERCQWYNREQIGDQVEVEIYQRHENVTVAKDFQFV